MSPNWRKKRRSCQLVFHHRTDGRPSSRPPRWLNTHMHVYVFRAVHVSVGANLKFSKNKIVFETMFRDGSSDLQLTEAGAAL